MIQCLTAENWWQLTANMNPAGWGSNPHHKLYINPIQS